MLPNISVFESLPAFLRFRASLPSLGREGNTTRLLNKD